MTAAHRARECYTRCVPRLARLRLLAGDGRRVLPPGAAGEVGQAAREIVAETGAAGQAAVAAVAESRRSSAAVFLAARQARLAAAADEVVAAAADGSAATLSRPLRRFEALTTALWTVQSGLRPRRRPGPRTGRDRIPDAHAGPRARRIWIVNHAGRYPMAEHQLHQHVEVSDDGRTVAAAEVIISEESGGTARVSLRAEAGHITPGRRASLVDAVLDLPQVRESARLEAAFPLGDGESLQRLQQRFRTSPPTRRGAAPCWMRAFRLAARARVAGASRDALSP